jgi:hypothetical protein
MSSIAIFSPSGTTPGGGLAGANSCAADVGWPNFGGFIRARASISSVTLTM